MNNSNKWKVTAIRMGYFPNMKYSQIVKLDKGKKDSEIDIPAWTTLVQGNGKNILIDSGICNPHFGNMIFTCKRGEYDTLENALKKAANICPEDIDIVIFTHLHWDHIGDSLRPFKNAEFIVQEKQWDFMLSCKDEQEVFYHTSRLICQDPKIDKTRWHLVNGEYELLSGIKLIPTPGHTPGHQCILIETENDKNLMVLGDAANTKYNVESKVLSGVINNPDEYIKSLELIESLADCILGGHEISGVAPFQNKNFPKL
jgi:N-acyl homoserine lactone hydrolase